jgi:hypothetical protein
MEFKAACFCLQVLRRLIKKLTPIGNKMGRVVVTLCRKIGEIMFVEKKSDAEQVELFALGLIAEPEDNGTLVLVPCADPVMCEIHGTYWVEKRIKESKKSLDTEEVK